MIFKKQKINYFILMALLLVTIWTWSTIFSQGDQFLEVIFLDVGQGDAIFIETPKNQQVLIDGGPDKTVLEKISREMPFYDKKIDLVILTHPDADHLTGLISILEHYQIGYIITSGLEKDTVAYDRWRDLIEAKNIPLILAQSGQKIIFQEDLFLEILWPDQSLINSFSDKANNVSVVGRLIYDQTEFLLTGDIEKKVESYLAGHLSAEKLESNIFKAPHHGSKTSSSQNFLRMVNPEVAVISVGVDNRFKHPDSVVLDRLSDARLFRTDQDDNIKILTDGNAIEIRP